MGTLEGEEEMGVQIQPPREGEVPSRRIVTIEIHRHLNHVLVAGFVTVLHDTANNGCWLKKA